MVSSILFIIILIFWAKYSDLKRDNENLRKKIAELEKNRPQTVQEKKDAIFQNVYSEMNKISTSNEVKNTDLNYEKLENVEKNNTTQTVRKEKKVDPQSSRNTGILVTGAILVVLSAIVFLTSTWDIIPNILKTIVIFVLIGVFYSASRIADVKLKLKKTSDTFYYIALAYIPIACVSASAFSLFGEFLSLFGDGNYIYLTLTSIFTATVYLFEEKRTDKKYLRIASTIFQYIALVCFSSIFEVNINLILFVLSVYNFGLLFSKNELTRQISKVVTWVITVLYVLIYSNTYSFVAIDLLAIPILMLNFYKLKKSNKLYEVLYLLSMYAFCFVFANLDVLNFTYEIKFVIMLISIIILYAYGSIDKKVQKNNSILTFCAMMIMYALSLDIEVSILPSYVVAYIITIMTFVNCFTRSINKEIEMNIIPIEIIIAGINTIVVLEIQPIWMVSIGIGLLIASNIKRFEEKFVNSLEIFGNVTIILSLIISCFSNFEMLKNIIIFAVILGTYIIRYLKSNKSFYKIMMYLSINSFIFSILYVMNLSEIETYVFPITTLGIMIAELYIKKLNDSVSEKYIISSLLFSFIALNIETDIIAFITIVILGIIFNIYRKKNDIEDWINIPFALAIIPGIYWFRIFEFEFFDFSFLVSLSVILILTYNSIKKFKNGINIYTYLSLGVILLQFGMLEVISSSVNTYINIIYIMIWSCIHLYFQENRYMECALCISSLCLYNTTISDFELNKITAINLLGYIIAFLFASRVIFKKLDKDSHKVLEYLGCFVIYAYAISDYADETDGMVFVGLVVLITMFSYTKKYGPIFLSSILAIIINSFLITREFWFSIPWWIYLLVVGFVLIGFAMNNEAKENKVKSKLLEKIKEYDNM